MKHRKGPTLYLQEFECRRSFGCLLVILTFSCLSCRSKSVENTLRIEGFAMATSYSVTAVGPVPGSLPARRLQGEVAATITRIESLMSIFDPGSDISRFNASSSTDWFPVSRETAEVVRMSLQVSRESGGAFDITVEPAVEKWGFGPAEPVRPVWPSNSNVPTPGRINYHDLSFRNAPPALGKSYPGLRIDLSGVAKGYAVDRVAEMLEARDIHRYMVEIGGELRTSGLNANGSPWTIGVAAPPDSHLDPILHVSKIAVATSGDYRNVFFYNGQRVSHIIDPGTGAPVNHALASVTVAGTECSRADALATALAVLGPDKGYDLAVRREWAAYFIIRGNPAWMCKTTPAFFALLRENADRVATQNYREK